MTRPVMDAEYAVDICYRVQPVARVRRARMYADYFPCRRQRECPYKGPRTQRATHRPRRRVERCESIRDQWNRSEVAGNNETLFESGVNGSRDVYRQDQTKRKGVARMSLNGGGCIKSARKSVNRTLNRVGFSLTIAPQVNMQSAISAASSPRKNSSLGQL